MKAFIVLAALVAVAAGNAIRSQSGWGQPQIPTINLELGAAAAAVASGHASAAQNLLELASGTADSPASLSSLAGVAAEVAQGEDISQVTVADKPSGATSTIQAIDVYNVAAANDVLEAAIAGGNGASAQNAANSEANGEAVSNAVGYSNNNVSTNN